MFYKNCAVFKKLLSVYALLGGVFNISALGMDSVEDQNQTYADIQNSQEQNPGEKNYQELLSRAEDQNNNFRACDAKDIFYSFSEIDKKKKAFQILFNIASDSTFDQGERISVAEFIISEG